MSPFLYSDNSVSTSSTLSPFLLHNNNNNNSFSPTSAAAAAASAADGAAIGSSLYERAAKLLFMCVGWARSIPSFVSLSPTDQTALLEEAWAPLFVVAMAQFWPDFDESEHILTPFLRHALRVPVHTVVHMSPNSDPVERVANIHRLLPRRPTGEAAAAAAAGATGAALRSQAPAAGHPQDQAAGHGPGRVHLLQGAPAPQAR